MPITIGGLAGVPRADAGVASGLINTGRQVGGAIGLAVASAVAATSTSNYVHSHSDVVASSSVAVDHGLQTALYALTGLPVVAALVALTLIRPARSSAGARSVEGEAIVLEEAA